MALALAQNKQGFGIGRSVNRLSHYRVCAEGVHVGSCAGTSRRFSAVQKYSGNAGISGLVTARSGRPAVDAYPR